MGRVRDNNKEAGRATDEQFFLSYCTDDGTCRAVERLYQMKALASAIT